MPSWLQERFSDILEVTARMQSTPRIQMLCTARNGGRMGPFCERKRSTSAARETKSLPLCGQFLEQPRRP